MSKLRPECGTAKGPSLPYDTALFLIRNSVRSRRELIYGSLHDGHGGHCAMGAFWEDNPKAVVSSSLVDEVAAVNDSIPHTASARERWKTVNEWLRLKIASIAGKKSVSG